MNKFSVLVHSDSYNKIYDKFSSSYTTTVPQVLEAGKSKIKTLADSVSGEGLLCGSSIVPSSHVLTWWKQ
jgi:hypothetical protein